VPGLVAVGAGWLFAAGMSLQGGAGGGCGKAIEGKVLALVSPAMPLDELVRGPRPQAACCPSRLLGGHGSEAPACKAGTR
jgi:hypothetical protein